MHEACYLFCMTDIQFEGESEFERPSVAASPPLLVRLLLRTGLVQTERGANYVLVGVVFVCVVVAIFLFSTTESGKTSPFHFVEGQSVFIHGGTSSSP